MRNIFLISAALMLSSCIPDMTPPKSIIKSVKTGDVEIEWYSGSASYVDVPDLVTITKGNHIDTICRSTNVADLKLDNNTIVVSFYGTPKQSDNIIQLPLKALNFNIVADTIYLLKSKTPD